MSPWKRNMFALMNQCTYIINVTTFTQTQEEIIITLV